MVEKDDNGDTVAYEWDVVNMYAYVGNNVVNLLDLLGLTGIITQPSTNTQGQPGSVPISAPPPLPSNCPCGKTEVFYYSMFFSCLLQPQNMAFGASHALACLACAGKASLPIPEWMSCAACVSTAGVQIANVIHCKESATKCE